VLYCLVKVKVKSVCISPILANACKVLRYSSLILDNCNVTVNLLIYVVDVVVINGVVVFNSCIGIHQLKGKHDEVTELC